MKVIVAVKRVVDHNVKIRVKADGTGVDVSNVKMSMNPFDEIAVEEAVRLKEAGIASEVVAVSIGPGQAKDTLLSALAMGADRGILITTDQRVEPLGVAKCLAAVVGEEAAGLVVLGKQAIDDDSNQTGQMLAALLDWPQATNAAKVTISGSDATVVGEVDGGRQTVRFSLPGIITTDLQLNQPRAASLPNVMKARSKPLAQRDAASIGVDLAPRLAVIETVEPAPRTAGIMVSSVDELVSELRDAKVVEA